MAKRRIKNPTQEQKDRALNEFGLNWDKLRNKEKLILVLDDEPPYRPDPNAEIDEE